MALLKGVNCAHTGATLTQALQAASAGGDTYDRYADWLIVKNGSAAAVTVTITPNYGPAYTPVGGVATPAGVGTPFTVNVAAGAVECIGVQAAQGAPTLGGGITYSATATVTVGAYFSG